MYLYIYLSQCIFLTTRETREPELFKPFYLSISIYLYHSIILSFYLSIYLGGSEVDPTAADPGEPSQYLRLQLPDRKGVPL